MREINKLFEEYENRRKEKENIPECTEKEEEKTNDKIV